MALNVKPVPIVAPQSVTTTTRPASGPRAGASASLSGPVDASAPISGSGLGDGAFSALVTQDNGDFSDHSFGPGSRRDNRDDLPNPKTGIIEFTSQGFAELLELRDTVSGGSSPTENKDRSKAMGRGIDYASALYENVIELAAGNKNLLGETVSITL